MRIFLLVNFIYMGYGLIYNIYNIGDGMRDSLLYKLVRPIIRCLFCFLYRPEIVGKENIPLSGRVVLAGNHTHNLDCILLISSTKRVIHFLAKEELLNGWYGFIFKCMGIIPVNRKIHDKGALNSAINYLNDDKVIGIFPEGTFSRNGDILPFKIGAVKMASEANSEIVPFVISGKYRIFHRGLRIEFLKSMVVPCVDDLTVYNEKLRNIISEKLRKG